MGVSDALILGLIQGITEFLPISSSGHLKLFEMFLGLKDLHLYVTFDLVCHLGTLFAIFAVLGKEIFGLFTKEKKMLWMLALAIAPLFPLYFLLHGIKSIYGLPQYLGYFFLLSALFLYLGEKFSAAFMVRRSSMEALFIGCAQAIAILPAVSRSGSTMAAARLMGWEHERAAKFSFFLAIPTILGGMMVEGLEMWQHKEQILFIPLSIYFTGFATAFLVGYFVLKMLLKWIKRISLKPFAAYCLIVGLVTLFYMNFVSSNG